MVLFCGLAETVDTGKERQILADFEPPRPIQTLIYHCDNHFYTEPIKKLLVDEGDEPYGVIVCDGKGALFGTIQGSSREVIHRMSVDLPNKHRRGGQSAKRFERLCEEKRKKYVQKVAEMAIRFYITDSSPNVHGIILAGSANLKDDLSKQTVFAKRLSHLVLASLDISYGGESGFSQVIDDCVDLIGSKKLSHEKCLLESYMEAIDQDNGRCCYSTEETLQALDMGAAEVIIVWENLEINRYQLRNRETGEERVLHLSREEEVSKNRGKHFRHGSVELEVLKKERLIDWIIDHHESFGCRLEIISDSTGVGSQFVRGFGGLGALLRWRVEFLELNSHDSSIQDWNSLSKEAKCTVDNDSASEISMF